MMFKKILIMLLSLFCAFSISADDVDAFIIPLSSPLYDLMDTLYAIAGNASPSSSRPWSYGEAKNIYAYIDSETFNEREKDFHAEVGSILKECAPRWMFDDNTFGFSANLSVNPEMYAHTNSTYDNDTDWAYAYEDRLAFLEGELDFSAFSSLYVYVNAEFTQHRWASDNIDYYDISKLPSFIVGKNKVAAIGANKVTENTVPIGAEIYRKAFSFNIPTHVLNMEVDWPKRAVFSLGGEYWNLLIGRERMKWGTSHISNLLIDDYMEYHDALRFTFRTKSIFRYEMLLSFFDGSFTSDQEPHDAAKILMAHRIEFRPVKWLTFSLSENVMYQYSNVIEGQYFNPAFIFHNLGNRALFNAIAWAEITASPYKGINMYGQFVIDQGKLPEESASEQDAWGVLAGIEYTHLLKVGYIKTDIEFAYTTPLLYRRDKVDFIVSHRDPSWNGGGAPLKLYYLGFKYGGDAMVLNMDLEYVIPESLRIGLIWQGMLHGEMSMFMSHNNENDNGGYPNRDGKTPSGEVWKAMLFSLYGEYDIPLAIDFIKLGLRGSLSCLAKAEGGSKSSDFQFSLAFMLRI